MNLQTFEKKPDKKPEGLLENKRRKTLTAPLLVLLIFVLLLLTRRLGPPVLTRENEYLLLTLFQIIIFLIPAGIYMRVCRVSFSRLRLRIFGINQILLVLSAFTVITSGSLLLDLAIADNNILTEGYTLYGAFASKTDGTATNVLWLIVSYAILPAFCEEFVFRSILCSEYEGEGGSFSAIILTSLFFAMLHLDLHSFGVYFGSGIVLALTMYASRSFFAAFAVHTVYNLFSIFGLGIVGSLYQTGGKTFYVLIIGSLFLLSAAVFCAESSRLYGTYADKNISDDYRRTDEEIKKLKNDKENGKKRSFGTLVENAVAKNIGAFLSPSALLCYLIYIAIMLFLR